MAAIRFPIGGRYRYYGSFKKQPKQKKDNERSTVMAKVLGIGILLVGMILITTLIGTLFLYAGWNWGLVPALEGSNMHLREIGLATTFWLSMCLSTIGGFFKTSVSTKE